MKASTCLWAHLSHQSLSKRQAEKLRRLVSFKWVKASRVAEYFKSLAGSVVVKLFQGYLMLVMVWSIGLEMHFVKEAKVLLWVSGLLLQVK